jgi:adenylate kinase family enzyme
MRVAIVGNSGSGKTTLAKALAACESVTILDLDLVYWEPDTSAERPSDLRIANVIQFCREHESWIIEGCYTDLIAATFPWKPELIFMDPGHETCISNCLSRAHESHKFRSKEEQDQNLAFLLQWVADYYSRDGMLSYQAHQALFDRYEGPKRRIKEQENSPTMRSTEWLPASRSVLVPLRSTGTDRATGSHR